MNRKRPGVLRIVEMEVPAIVGICEDEQTRPQTLVITVGVEVDFRAVGAAEGKIRKGLDYARFALFLRHRISSRAHELLEELVLEAGDAAMAEFPVISRMDLAVRKPGAVPGAKYVEAQMEFRR